MLKDITKSFYGKVVEYLDIKYDDGGFQLVEYEESEEEKERSEKASKLEKKIRTHETYEEIREQLEPGESAIVVHPELLDIGRGGTTLPKKLVFYSIEDIEKYALDVAMPEYIPEGYKFDRAELAFIGKDYDKIHKRANELAEEAKEKGVPYLWEKIEDTKEMDLRIYYESRGKGTKPGYSTISVEINLTDHDGANQRLVEKGTNYEVKVLNMGEKEVLKYTYSLDDIWEYYVFKIPNREYKTYELWHVKNNPLPFIELEKMIDSFK